MPRRVSLLPSLSFRRISTAGVTQKARDATEVSPDIFRVLLENASVRVVEFRAARGQKMPMHTHPPYVSVNMSRPRLKVTYPDGKSEVQEPIPGDVVWSEAVEHAGEVVSGSVHAILVEVKGAAAPSRGFAFGRQVAARKGPRPIMSTGILPRVMSVRR